MFEPGTPSNDPHKSFLDKGFESDLHKNPLQQYNYFIRCYNTEENIVDNIKLDELRTSRAFDTFWTFSSRWFWLVMILVLMVVPIFGFFLYVWVLIISMIYYSRLQTIESNTKKVENPFQNMVFCPPLCKTSSNNKFYEIKIQGKVFRDLVSYYFCRFGRL